MRGSDALRRRAARAGGIIVKGGKLGADYHPPRMKKLPGQDSNLDKESQNLLCYRYTTG
jgi:hypothetical protein